MHSQYDQRMMQILLSVRQFEHFERAEAILAICGATRLKDWGRIAEIGSTHEYYGAALSALLEHSDGTSTEAVKSGDRGKYEDTDAANIQLRAAAIALLNNGISDDLALQLDALPLVIGTEPEGWEVSASILKQCLKQYELHYVLKSLHILSEHRDFAAFFVQRYARLILGFFGQKETAPSILRLMSDLASFSQVSEADFVCGLFTRFARIQYGKGDGDNNLQKGNLTGHVADASDTNWPLDKVQDAGTTHGKLRVLFGQTPLQMAQEIIVTFRSTRNQEILILIALLVEGRAIKLQDGLKALFGVMQQFSDDEAGQ